MFVQRRARHGLVRAKLLLPVRRAVSPTAGCADLGIRGFSRNFTPPFPPLMQRTARGKSLPCPPPRTVRLLADAETLPLFLSSMSS